MKTKILLFGMLTLSTLSVSAQALLNKIKNKAAQEVNKLEQNATSKAPTHSTNSKNKISGNVTRTVLATMRQEENFEYGESCIDLGASINEISFIAYSNNGNNRQCYSYRNGTRTAITCPQSKECGGSLQCSFNQLRLIDLESEEAKKYIVNETETHQVAQPTITDQQLKMMSAYMTKEQIEDMKKQLAAAQKQTANQTYSTVKSRTIKFNGKTYGPFSQLRQFYLTADGKAFYAVTVDVAKDMSYTHNVISSGSTATIAIPGMMPPLTCMASSDNSEFAAVVANDQIKYSVVTSKGKKIEIPDYSKFGGAWYSALGGHMLMLLNSQLLYDGQVTKTFTDKVPDPCNLFVTGDGKNVTTVVDNIISFADGDRYEYPLKISLVNVGGKLYFKWLALENQDVVIYQKPY